MQKIFILLIFLTPVSLYAQIPQDFPVSVADSVKKDSIKLEKGDLVAFLDTLFTGTDTIVIRKEVWIVNKDSLVLRLDSLIMGDQVMLFARDTVFNTKDTIVIIADTILSRNERVLQHIKEFSERDKFFPKLLKNILVFNDYKPTATSAPSEYSDKKYEAYEGKIIRNIDVKILNVFGYSLNDPTSRPHGLIEKGGNAMHVKSQRWLIRNRLLFKKGDPINSLKIAESERLFRDNNYIYDARIIVKDTFSTDSVDVMVMVQDVWSISAGVGLDVPRNKFDFSIRDVNFIGLGQTLESKVRFDPEVPSGYNYLGAYSVNNIYKTFITGRLYYTYQFGETRYGMELNREFISPAIKWAGGVNLNSAEFFHSTLDQNDSVVSRQFAHLMQGDFWLGYGVNINAKSNNYKGSRFITSGRVIRNKYLERPVLHDTLVNNYYDSYFYLSSIGIIRKRFYKDSYIFRFGRTEDIPEGDLIALTAGIEDRPTRRRPYLGIDMGLSRYTPLGYIFTRFGVGSFNENSQWTEGTILSHFLYFSPLIKINRWKWRHFLGCRYTGGINTVKGNYININLEQGLRGFRSGELRGTSKLVINYETNIFPPMNLLGFRMAMILYADFAWIGEGEKLVDKNNFFPGYGIGLRFRNDHLIFNMIQVFLGYYPNSPSIGARELILYERGRFYYGYHNLNFSRPSLLPYL